MSKNAIEFKCTGCGSKHFEIPKHTNPNDTITCTGCGATGRYADIQAVAIKLAKESVLMQMKNALGKAGFK